MITIPQLSQPSHSIAFFNREGEQMLRIAPDGFYVRGQKVEQDDNEARVVYEQFKAWMAQART